MPERIIIDSTLAPTTPRMRTHSMQHSSPRGFGVCGSLLPGCKQLTIARVFTVGYNIKRPAGADSWPFRPWNGWRGLKGAGGHSDHRGLGTGSNVFSDLIAGWTIPIRVGWTTLTPARHSAALTFWFVLGQAKMNKTNK